MSWLFRFWAWVRSWFVRQPNPLLALKVEELPDTLDPKLVYLVGENDHLWFAALICPCGCGETIQLSCLADARPRWRATVHEDGSVSLQPSVNRVKGCLSHFFLRHGFIEWCDDRQRCR